MSKSIAEITKLLDVAYDGPTFEKNGFTYIPWQENVKQANRIFGVDGYDIATTTPKRDGDGYTSIATVTVYPSDGRAFSRVGVGYNEVTSSQSGEMTDTALKGAASDAISRALRLFGDAFGLSIGGKTRGVAKTSGTRPASKAGGARRDGPTEKQTEWLLKKGVSQDEVDEMSFEDARAKLDELFGKSPKSPTKAAPAKAKPALKDILDTDDEEDE